MPDSTMLTEIRRWFAYARWANAHMLDACDTVPADALTREMGTSFGSLLGTLEHLYGADWVWLERFHGRSPSVWPAGGMLATVAAFREAWTQLADDRTRFLDTLDASRLAAPLKYRNMKGEPFELPLDQVLFHVSNHATYHRGQIIQFVRQLGGTARSTDYLYWLPDAG